MIARGCRAQGVAFEAPSALLNGSIDPPRYLRCRSCSGVTEFAAAAGSGANPASVRPDCPFCGASLRWHCPSCGRDHWVDVARCGCGFLRESVEPVDRLLLEARRLFGTRDYRGAIDRLRQVQGYVPDHPGARKGIRTAERFLGEADRARAAFETARGRRHLVAAQAAVRRWSQVAAADDPDVLAAVSQVEANLRAAHGWVRRAEAALTAGDLPLARQGFDQAQGHRRRPRRSPPGTARGSRPTPPANWSPSSTATASASAGPRGRPTASVRSSFRVVRKTGGLPTQATDGVLVAETSQSEADDPAVRPGESVGYAVYATRGKIHLSRRSHLVAPGRAGRRARLVRRSSERRSGPVLDAPAGGDRRPGDPQPAPPPRDERDGDLVRLLPDSLTDRGLDNDRAYHYAVFAVYRDPGTARGAAASGCRGGPGDASSLVRPPRRSRPHA